MVAPSNPSLVTGFVVIRFYPFFTPLLLFPIRPAMPSEPKTSNLEADIFYYVQDIFC